MRRPTKAEAARENAQVNARIMEENRLRAQIETRIEELGTKDASIDLLNLDLDVLFEEEGELWVKDRINEAKPDIKEECRAEITEELRASIRADVVKEVRAEFEEKIDNAEWTAEQNTRLEAENKALRARLRTFEKLPSTPRRKRAEIHQLRQEVAELTAEIAKLHGEHI